MSKLAKTLLIMVGALCLLIGGAFLAAKSWWENNSERLKMAATQARSDGEVLGRASDNTGCVTAGLGRYRAAPGMTNAIMTRIYLGSCLEQSRPSPGFCDGVPPRTEIMKSGIWAGTECARLSAGDSHCSNLVGEIQEYCHPRVVAPS
jgi:hypothetical protein